MSTYEESHQHSRTSSDMPPRNSGKYASEGCQTSWTPHGTERNPWDLSHVLVALPLRYCEPKPRSSVQDDTTQQDSTILQDPSSTSECAESSQPSSLEAFATDESTTTPSDPSCTMELNVEIDDSKARTEPVEPLSIINFIAEEPDSPKSIHSLPCESISSPSKTIITPDTEIDEQSPSCHPAKTVNAPEAELDMQSHSSQPRMAKSSTQDEIAWLRRQIQSIQDAHRFELFRCEQLVKNEFNKAEEGLKVRLDYQRTQHAKMIYAVREAYKKHAKVVAEAHRKEMQILIDTCPPPKDHCLNATPLDAEYMYQDLKATVIHLKARLKLLQGDEYDKHWDRKLEAARTAERNRFSGEQEARLERLVSAMNDTANKRVPGLRIDTNVGSHRTIGSTGWNRLRLPSSLPDWKSSSSAPGGPGVKRKSRFHDLFLEIYGPEATRYASARGSNV